MNRPPTSPGKIPQAAQQAEPTQATTEEGSAQVAQGSANLSTAQPQTAHSTKPLSQDSESIYEKRRRLSLEIRLRPEQGGGRERISIQHSKGRMTVWERLRTLSDQEPAILFQNWGPDLDGAGIVTSIMQIDGRDVAFYGHDFTQKAGSVNADNGAKLTRLIEIAAKRGIVLIGINESAGAYVPAGVGGLDGYSEAFSALRKISGIVPSIMLMFGYNAGGGSYLPRQGSFVIQPQDTFFGLTGPQVVREVLGEDISADELGGPAVHGASGVTDIVARDELDALRKAVQILKYIPDNNSQSPKYWPTSDPIDRKTDEIDHLLRRTFSAPSGFNTPFDITLIIQQICDHGDFLEIQPQRAGNLITAFGRLNGYVTGFVANNSAVASGQIDIHAAYKGARFIRFCNLYNIPLIFLEDTTGFLPGREQEAGGIVQAGRALMEAIIDLRVPRINLIIRNAFGGAYAIWNGQYVGADLVLAYPTARVAVMGPAGKEFVYKQEIGRARQQYRADIEAGKAAEEAQSSLEEKLYHLSRRYEEELMNPYEALALGSISQILLPEETRKVLAEQLSFLMRHYQPVPLAGPQREFF